MEGLGRNRKARVGGLVVIGALIGLVTFVVVPALATPAGVAVPPPSFAKGITPIDVNTGGQSNDCAVFYPGGWAGYQFRIANPKTTSPANPYTTTVGPNNTKVTFAVTIDPPEPNPGGVIEPASKPKQTYLSFSSTGAVVADVGIKGGTDESRYNYTGELSAQPNGYTNPSYGFGVGSDSYLHAPAQSVTSTPTPLTPTQLYSISNLTFCFTLGATVSGTVYQDANQNGKNDDGSSNQQSGWTVNLYNTPSTGSQTPIATTTSGSNGSYSFTVPSDASTTYRVCEAPPSGTWAQTEPYSPPTPTACTGASPELPKGYSFTTTQNSTGNDFGNVLAVPCSLTPFGLPPTYQIQLAACKPGQTFVFSSTSGVVDGNTNTPQPTVSVFVGDESQQPLVPLVEKIVEPFTIQTPQPAVTLVYDDVFPFSLADAVPMPFCNLDPRASGSEFTLQTAYSTNAGASGVLPSPATSCLILQSQSATRPDLANHPDQGTYTAYVYSELDGLRGVGP